MAQDFTYPFDETDNVRDTMVDIFDNTESLRTSFSGSGQPGNPTTGMTWADTGSNLFKIRGITAWQSIMELDTGNLFIGPDSIEAVHISGAARKPSLVEGETIRPDRIENMTACNLRANPASLPSLSTDVKQWQSVPPSSESAVTQCRFYWSGSTTSTSFEMHVYGSNAIARFQLGSDMSSYVTVVSPGWSTGTPASKTYSGGLGAGWYLVQVRFKWQSAPGTGYLGGYSFGVKTT